MTLAEIWVEAGQPEQAVPLVEHLDIMIDISTTNGSSTALGSGSPGAMAAAPVAASSSAQEAIVLRKNKLHLLVSARLGERIS